jgi:thioredoxin reductase (NADPH)
MACVRIAPDTPVPGAAAGLVLIGSRQSATTLHLREFLSRNGQPFTYHQVENDPDVQALLDRFPVGVPPAKPRSFWRRALLG